MLSELLVAAAFAGTGDPVTVFLCDRAEGCADEAAALTAEYADARRPLVGLDEVVAQGMGGEDALRRWHEAVANGTATASMLDRLPFTVPRDELAAVHPLGDGSGRAALTVEADVASARVFVDGEDVGAAPAAIAVLPGWHRVTVERPGRRTAWVDSFEAKDGDVVDLVASVSADDAVAGVQTAVLGAMHGVEVPEDVTIGLAAWGRAHGADELRFVVLRPVAGSDVGASGLAGPASHPSSSGAGEAAGPHSKGAASPVEAGSGSDVGASGLAGPASHSPAGAGEAAGPHEKGPGSHTEKVGDWTVSATWLDVRKQTWSSEDEGPGKAHWTRLRAGAAVGYVHLGVREAVVAEIPVDLRVARGVAVELRAGVLRSAYPVLLYPDVAVHDVYPASLGVRLGGDTGFYGRASAMALVPWAVGADMAAGWALQPSRGLHVGLEARAMGTDRAYGGGLGLVVQAGASKRIVPEVTP